MMMAPDSFYFSFALFRLLETAATVAGFFSRMP
jgi:hypothetical protein